MSRGQVPDQVQIEIWKATSALWALATPKCHPPKRPCTATAAKFGRVDSSTDATPQTCLSMPEVDIQAMEESHRQVVTNIETNPPILSYPKRNKEISHDSRSTVSAQCNYIFAHALEVSGTGLELSLDEYWIS
ncbi:hypothetical protein N7G274_001696 [Stereocaulon virgatum]|uniref:Uncharacterized protein n=1 Tax=Stereocaulon virgatum TaxID=373712 RepID=A0ABR4ANI9_9LECA